MDLYPALAARCRQNLGSAPPYTIPWIRTYILYAAPLSRHLFYDNFLQDGGGGGPESATDTLLKTSYLSLQLRTEFSFCFCTF